MKKPQSNESEGPEYMDFSTEGQEERDVCLRNSKGIGGVA